MYVWSLEGQSSVLERQWSVVSREVTRGQSRGQSSVVSRQSRGDSKTVERRTLKVHLAMCFHRRTRRVLISLVVEPTVVSFQQSVERGATLGRSGRVVEARPPVSEDARCDPESSRTSGLSAGSGDPGDRRSTVDVSCAASGASDRLERVTSGDLFEIVGFRWTTIRVSSDLFCCLN